MRLRSKLGKTASKGMMETLDRATWIQTPTERRQDETQMTERGWEVC